MKAICFTASFIMWPHVFVPEDRYFLNRNGPPDRGSPRYSIAFPASDLPEELLGFPKVRTGRKATIDVPWESPANVSASSFFTPTLIPDDLKAYRRLTLDAADYRVPLDRLLFFGKAELAASGWENTGAPSRLPGAHRSGLNLVAMSFEVKQMEERLKAIIEAPEDYP